MKRLGFILPLAALFSLLACSKVGEFGGAFYSNPLPRNLLSDIPRVIRGGVPYEISLDGISDGVRKFSELNLEYSFDASNFALISRLVEAGSSYLWTPPLVDKKNVILRLSIKDPSGRLSEVRSNEFEIRSRLPHLTLSGSEKVTNFLSSMTVEGTCEEGLEIFVSSVPMHSALPSKLDCLRGNWAVVLNESSDGKRLYTFKQIDDAGLEKLVSFEWTRDTVLPAFTVATSANVVTKNVSASFSGACEAGLPISVLGSPAASLSIPSSLSCVSGSWTLDATVSADASYSIALSQKDEAENTKTLSLTLVRDSALPNLTVVPASDVINNSNSLLLSGTCESGVPVVLTKILGTFTAPSQVSCTNGAWSATLSGATSDGKRTVQISQQDLAGNLSSLSRSWTRDTASPVLSVTGSLSRITNANQIAISGTCEAGLSISLSANLPTGIVIPSQVSCSPSGTFSFTAQLSTDGTRSITLTETDIAQNSSSLILSVTRDTVAPDLSITSPSSPSVVNNLSTFVLSGLCENGLPILITKSGPAYTAPSQVSCSNGVWTLSLSIAADGTRGVTFTQTDAAGNSTSDSLSWERDTVLPVVDNSFFKVEDGAESTASNYVRISFKATDNRNVSAFCLNYNQIAAPSSSDACWVNVDASSPGQPVGPSVSFHNYYYRIGAFKGNYVIRGYAKDHAGNISSILGQASIQYTPPTPADLSFLIATNTDAPQTLGISETTIQKGQEVYIKWKAVNTDPSAVFMARPIMIYYTTDDVAWTPISSSIENGPNGGCSVNHANSALDNGSTGCYVWRSNVDTGKYFRIRIQATNQVPSRPGVEGPVVFGRTNALNLSNFKFLAGNTESGLGGTALKAVFQPLGRRPLVVHPSGKIFVLDRRGLMLVDPLDGNQKLYIPTNGQLTDGTIAQAKLKNPQAIALDFKGNLLIADSDRIRRVNLSLSPVSVETIIGGGSDSGDEVDPLNFKAKNTITSALLTALPNGDIYFISDQLPNGGGSNMPSAAHYKIRFFDHVSGKVKAIEPKGFAQILGVPDQTIEECQLIQMGLGYSNTAQSPVNQMFLMLNASANPLCVSNTTTPSQYADYVPLDPATRSPNGSIIPLQATRSIGVPALGAREYYYTLFTAMNGKIYSYANAVWANSIVNRFENSSWSPVLGTRKRGVCPDGTLATSCSVSVEGVFVDASDTVYFIDRGSIRMVQADGTILTLAGERRNYGDGNNPLNARFGAITSFDLFRDGEGVDRFTLVDATEFRIREFTEAGTIDSIAGDGSDDVNFSDPSEMSGPAKDKPISFGGDTANPFITVDQLTGDVNTLRQGGLRPFKIIRQTGIWAKLGQTNPGGYGPMVIAESPAKVLVATFNFCSIGTICNAKLLEYDKATMEGTVLVSHPVMETVPGAFCADGVALNNCVMPKSGWGGGLTQGQYDPVTDAWYLKERPGNYPNHSANRIVKINKAAGVMQTLATLPTFGTADAGDFAYRRTSDGSKEEVFYCNNGSLYKYDMKSLTHSKISFPVSMVCPSTARLVYSEKRGSLIFNYTFQGLPGIAELLNP